MKKFIFACVHNAGRSQIAAAFFNAYARSGCHAISAGTQPASRIHPEVVEAMQEIGLDLSAAKPQKLTAELLNGADVLVTMGCGEECPFMPGLKVIDWSLPDPKGQPPEVVRRIRDDIHEQVRQLFQSQYVECCAMQV